MNRVRWDESGKADVFVVSGIVGVLVIVALAWLVRPQGYSCGKTARTHALLGDLVTAVKSFQLEYDRLPKENGEGQDVELVFDGSINTEAVAVLATLAGEDEGMNPREILFFEPDISYKESRIGIVYEESDPIKLLDSWGQPIHLIFDSNRDGKIVDPEGGEPLHEDVVAWSDGRPDTEVEDSPWENNVTSWDRSDR